MKPLPGLSENELTAICNILKKHVDVEEAFLFGSRSKGNYHRGSDVDIVLKGVRLNHESITSVSYELNEETQMPYHFDILNYRTIVNNDLIDHINRVGIKIYGEKSSKKTVLA